MGRKLSPKATSEIRASTATGKALARRYGVSEALISRVRAGGLHAPSKDISRQCVVRVPAGMWIPQQIQRREWFEVMA